MLRRAASAGNRGGPGGPPPLGGLAGLPLVELVLEWFPLILKLLLWVTGQPLAGADDCHFAGVSRLLLLLLWRCSWARARAGMRHAPPGQRSIGAIGAAAQLVFRDEKSRRVARVSLAAGAVLVLV